MANNYTVEDVMELAVVLREEGFTFSSSVLERNKFVLPLRGNMMFWYPEQSDFVYDTPIAEVPKFVNNNNLEWIIKWRLRIGK